VSALADSAPRRARRGWSHYAPIVGPWLILGALVVVAAILSPAFLDPTNLRNILRQAAPLAIVALGQTLVILIGGIDVSVGSVISLTTVIGGSVMGDSNARILPTVLIVLALGMIVGLFHYLLIVRVGTDAFVTTLGTLLALEGLNLIYTGGAPRSNVTDEFRKLAEGTILGVPAVIPLVALLAAGLGLLLRRTPFGRRFYAVGGNKAAARLSGVRTTRIEGIAYVLCSILAVLAGLVLLARIGTGATLAGEGLELDSIAAVLIGGTVFGGGKGGVGGTIAGVLILTILFNIFNLLAISRFAHLIIKGVVIVVGIAMYSRRSAET
jgi:ribose/xylose/arabinose/galactoside ABC-type transport system permease subunit